MARSSPTWCQDAEPDFSVTALDFFPGSRPENNPKREMTWSAIFADTVANSWVVVASTPLDLDGRHVATLSHDVLLKELMARVASDRLPGAYNMLFRDDGQLIAHPELDMEGATAPYDILGEGPPTGDKPTPLGASWGSWPGPSGSWPTRSSGARRPCGRPTRAWSSGWSCAPGS